MTERIHNLTALSSTLRADKTFEIQLPKHRVWEWVEGFASLLRCLNFPKARFQCEASKDGGYKVLGAARMLGLKVTWEELPLEWQHEDSIRLARVFQSGPLELMNLEVKLRETGESASRIHVAIEIVSEHWIARRWVQHWLIPRAMRSLERSMTQFQCRDPKRIQSTPWSYKRSRINASELGEAMDTLRSECRNSQLCNGLEALIRNAPDESMQTLRPLQLARQWNADPWAVLNLFYHAVCLGLLRKQWRLICPKCRQVAFGPSESLQDIPERGTCNHCVNHFDVFFDEHVELVFFADPAIRQVDMRQYCFQEPIHQSTVLSQIHLRPGQRRLWQLPFLHQKICIRSPQVRTDMKLEAGEDEDLVFIPIILCHEEQFDVEYEYGKAQDQAVLMVNPNDYPVQVTLERLERDETRLTASMATNWQLYRNLFPKDLLEANRQIKVHSQLIVFAELHEAAGLYESLGTDHAYALVKNQTRILSNVVAQFHGAVVKTTGDGIMAVFNSGVEALGAILEMHQKIPLASPDPQLADSLRLKSSMHQGPCLVVNAGKRMDFFGSMVNLAMQYLYFSQGDDCILSQSVFQTPEVFQAIRDRGLTTESLDVQLSGIKDAQSIVRLRTMN